MFDYKPYQNNRYQRVWTATEYLEYLRNLPTLTVIRSTHSGRRIVFNKNIYL